MAVTWRCTIRHPRAQADAIVYARLNTPLPADANDTLYQWEASADYDASRQLESIRATLLAINADDDERYLPALGLLQQAIARVPQGGCCVSLPAPTQPAMAPPGRLASGSMSLRGYWVNSSQRRCSVPE
jgi:hypothetical protein